MTILTSFNFSIILRGSVYTFESTEEDPLRFIIKFDDQWTLYRDINCDEATERMFLERKYVSVHNRIPKDDSFITEVYNGREISSLEFMTQLLDHVLEPHGVI